MESYHQLLNQGLSLESERQTLEKQAQDLITTGPSVAQIFEHFFHPNYDWNELAFINPPLEIDTLNVQQDIALKKKKESKRSSKSDQPVVKAAQVDGATYTISSLLPSYMVHCLTEQGGDVPLCTSSSTLRFPIVLLVSSGRYNAFMHCLVSPAKGCLLVRQRRDKIYSLS
ncbi:hypothetical protein GEMRC1_003405 [Eukaryota sp. GEM-RC1]